MTSKKPSNPKPFKYRLSDKTIRLWTKILITVMIVGIVGGFAFSAIAISILGDEEWINTVTLLIMVGVGVAVPLVVSAILGGIAIHRFGFIGTALLAVSMIVFGFGAATGDSVLAIVGAVGIIAGGLLTWLFGYLGKVPMWLQLATISSPRLYVTKGGKDTAKKKQAILYTMGIFVVATVFIAVTLFLNR